MGTREAWAGDREGKTGHAGRLSQTLEQASLRRYLGRDLKEEESKPYKHLEESARLGIGCTRILRY